MASLTDLFNPSFFMFLGIMVLIIALLVVYFESKIRVQNHKIASMLSLVSTLAEDMNGMKIGLNHLAMSNINGGYNNIPLNTPFPNENLGSINPLMNEKLNDLIEVSDDEDEDEDEDDNIDDSEDLEDINDINDIDETSQESNDDGDNKNNYDDEDNNIKVIKLNISQEESDSEENAFDLDNRDDLADLDGEFEPYDDIPEISEKYAEKMLNLKYDEVKEENSLAENNLRLEENVNQDTNLNKSVSELKTISVNLGDEHSSEHIDFKKLQLPKLRSIAIEKGLTTSLEAQKLKKPELLKLLGAE